MMIHKQMNNNEKNRTQKAKGSRMRNKRQPEEHTDSSISSRLHHRERKKKTKFRGAPHTLRAQLNVGVLFSSFRCFCRVLSSPSVRPSCPREFPPLNLPTPLEFPPLFLQSPLEFPPLFLQSPLEFPPLFLRSPLEFPPLFLRSPL
jgi:hypothetical protein